MLKYLIIGTFLLTSGCVQHQTKIGHGLEFLDLSSGNYTIIDENSDFVVYPKIIKYCKTQGRILGYRVDPEGDNSNGSANFTENLRYFELNIKTREIHRNDKVSLADLESKCGWRLLP